MVQRRDRIWQNEISAMVSQPASVAASRAPWSSFDFNADLFVCRAGAPAWVSVTVIGAFVLLGAAPAVAQTQIDLTRQAKQVDFSAASSTKPVKSGSTIPAKCGMGDMFFKYDAPAGQNLFGCVATDTWVMQGGGSGGSGMPNPSATGIAICVGANCSSSTTRVITGTSNEIVATNGDGVTGNPTLALAPIFDISGKTSTKPVKTGTTLPGACSVGELFYKSNATAGQNLHGCTSANTWTLLGDGVGGGSGGAPIDAPYWTASAVAGTSAEVNLGSLSSGLLKHTVSAGVSTPAGAVAGVDYTPGPATNGLVACTGSNCSGTSARTITGTSNEVTVANGDGVGGNPAIGLASAFDISGKTSTKPVKTGTALPGACSIGELFYKSDATAGQNLYGCTSTNTWTVLGDGGGSANSISSASTFGNDNRLIRSDGTGRGVQASGVTVDDSDNVTVPGNLTVQGTINAGNGTVEGEVTMPETAANGTEYRSWLVPSALTATLRMRFPNAVPSAGQVMLFGTPSGNISDISFGLPAALSANGSNCANQFPRGIDASGNAEGCASVGTADISNDAVTRDKVSAILRTRQVTFLLGADNGSVLVDTDDQPSFFINRLGSGITITEVHCESDGGAPSINVQRDDGTPANVLSSNLSCSTSGATGTINTAEDNVANGERLDFVMAAAGGIAKRITVTVTYTVD